LHCGDFIARSLAMNIDELIAHLPLPQRLALAYAPASARGAWAVFLALDARLAGVVRGAKEPMIGQIKLAWWRDRLREDAVEWPQGEPLLAALGEWQGRHGALASLVDAWEILLGDAPLPAVDLRKFARLRADAVMGLCAMLGAESAPERNAKLAMRWGLADLAGHVSHGDERRAALGLMAEYAGGRVFVPRRMRPLLVLNHFAQIQARGEEPRIIAMLSAMRLGILGI
jgi:phytoene synthase